MWNAIVLAVGLVLGVFLSKIEYIWTINSQLSISLWKEWIFIFFFASATYFSFIFYPLFHLVHQKSKFYTVQLEPDKKKVSARQELKRRGSWPVAYSRNIHTRYQPEF